MLSSLDLFKNEKQRSRCHHIVSYTSLLIANPLPRLNCRCIVLGTLLAVYFSVNIFYSLLAGENPQKLSLSELVEGVSKEYTWALRLIINCIGYSAVVVPGVLIYKYTKKTHYLERSGKCSYLQSGDCISHFLFTILERNYLYGFVKSCFSDYDRIDLTSQAAQDRSAKQTVAKECILLTYCFVGLMGSYLTWGVLQEKVMTTEYVGLDGKSKAFFKDSQFLVFANRILALIIAVIYQIVRKQARHRAPLFKYSYASFSNIMSAWFQYEALKFISFPTQVLAKSCKLIPVMIMGRIVSKNKYEFYEYVVAVTISIGMVFFLSGSYDQGKHSPVTTFTGLFLLVMYMIFDSFTSNWQSDIFKAYNVTSMQMMYGVNLFSTLFTAASLLVQGGFTESLQFSTEHPAFLVDCVVLSISSSIGSLFIFFTIAKFGAVVFTIIMTLRQALAILLSCLIYNHDISPLGVFGVCIVFLAIFVRVYGSYRLKKLRRQHEQLLLRLKV